MDKWNLIAFNAFIKLHDIGNMLLGEAYYCYTHICVDDAIKDIYIVGYKNAKEYKLLDEVRYLLSMGYSIREALREWDLI